MYPQECPAKRRRATLETGPPRDSRMGVTDIRPGEPTGSPTQPYQDIPSPPMPGKLQGFGDGVPDSTRTVTLHPEMTFSLNN